MKLHKIIIECSCGALIESGAYDRYGDLLDKNTCPNCKKLITSNIVNKKDGLAVFLKRTDHWVYRPNYWNLVEEV